MMKNFEDHWHEMETHFDFEMVYKTMKLLDWTWGQNEEASIPSVKRIKARAEEICRSAYEKEMQIESAGFSAHYEKDSLHLCFIVDSWETS